MTDRLVSSIYSKYSDNLTPYHLVANFEHVHYYMYFYMPKIAGQVANSADLDQMPHSVASDLRSTLFVQVFLSQYLG